MLKKYLYCILFILSIATVVCGCKEVNEPTDALTVETETYAEETVAEQIQNVDELVKLAYITGHKNNFTIMFDGLETGNQYTVNEQVEQFPNVIEGVFYHLTTVVNEDSKQYSYNLVTYYVQEGDGCKVFLAAVDIHTILPCSVGKHYFLDMRDGRFPTIRDIDEDKKDYEIEVAIIEQ